MKISKLLPALLLLAACDKKTESRNDQLYSRHLQQQETLTIINTPIPSDKSTLNLLLLNDGQMVEQLRVKEIVDSLYELGRIKPLVVVGIHTNNREQEFGVSDQRDYMNRGTKAKFYEEFIADELYPFVKKRAGVRKFNSVAIAGFSLGGLSAMDMAWDHADKIDKVGVFSGSFWWRDKSTDDSSYSDDKNRIMYAKLKSSRKRPKIQYWFYVGGAEENGDRDKDGVIDAVDDMQDIVNLLIEKKDVQKSDLVFTIDPNGHHDWSWWSAKLPDFLIWAFGK